uniref:C-type lectin domain-containing protein n=1 Tax=Astyanax mexicanus TaxID=7994 RepID=A0A3B1JHJ7_ASTMX
MLPSVRVLSHLPCLVWTAKHSLDQRTRVWSDKKWWSRSTWINLTTFLAGSDFQTSLLNFVVPKFDSPWACSVKRLCPHRWKYFNYSLYYIVTEKKRWSESKKDCEQKGAGLAIINSKEEQVRERERETERDTEAWIGLTDAETEGVWKWVDDSVLTTKLWWTGEPNNYRNEDCTITGYKNANSIFSWADYHCGHPVSSICEKRFTGL